MEFDKHSKLFDVKVKFMALSAVIFRRLMLEMAVDAFSVMRRFVRIGTRKFLCFFR